MRLRIQTLSPLPEVKAWFIPDLQDAQQTVFDLKGLLCRGITQLRTNRIDAEQLTLLLDGFELLDDSPVSVVRDEDLIVVKMAYHRHKTNLLSRTQISPMNCYLLNSIHSSTFITEAKA